MKSPKTKFVVISAIGLVSIVGIFVSAQTPTPSPSSQDLPFHLVMICATVDKTKLTAALKDLPSDTYNFNYENASLGAGLPPITPSPCPVAHLNGNATQRALFKNTKALRKFLKAAGL